MPVDRVQGTSQINAMVVTEQQAGESSSGIKRLLNRLIFPASAGAVGAEIGYVLAGVFSVQRHWGVWAGIAALLLALGIQFWERYNKESK